MNRSLLLCLLALCLLFVLPGCDTEVEGDTAGECSDGVDNDQDGPTDCDDSGCATATACEEPAPDTTMVDSKTGTTMVDSKTGITLAYIPAGSFLMGSPASEEERKGSARLGISSEIQVPQAQRV